MQWLLVDGNNWFAMDWYASQGTQTEKNFLYRLETAQSQYSIDRVVIAWDSRSTFRRDLLPTYKTHRAGKPDGFEDQLARTKAAIRAQAYESFEVDGFEGDDILATLVQDCLDEGVSGIIASADRDLHQCLVKGHITQVTRWIRSSATRVMVKAVTADTLYRDYGVHPWQWIDYRVMVGDDSDGIVGCKGIGEKAAQALLAKCGDLDRFYRSPFAAGLTNHQRRLLLEHRPYVANLRQVLTLRRDVPLAGLRLEHTNQPLAGRR